MTTEFHGHSLETLIKSAKKAVLLHGERRISQKGETISLSNVKLTWEKPLQDLKSYFYWDKKSDDWYQRVFVQKRKENAPEFAHSKGDIIFPYTYAQRSRFYDGGFGYITALISTTRKYGKSVTRILGSQDNFFDYLSFVSDFTHLQNVLASLNWLGKKVLRYYVENPKSLLEILSSTRQDSLQRLVTEVKGDPESRRLVTPSFVYSKVDQGLDSFLDIPPYQLFQILPGRENDPINSAHFHRSLDANGGVQLDFHHDLDWVKIISGRTGREINNITIMAGDFHVYLNSNKGGENLSGKNNIVDALKSVTGAYICGSGAGSALLENNDFYKRNAGKVYCRLLE